MPCGWRLMSKAQQGPRIDNGYVFLQGISEHNVEPESKAGLSSLCFFNPQLGAS